MNDVIEKLKFPAIGLIIVGGFNAMFGLMALLSGLLRLAGIMKEQIPVNEAERIGYLIGTFGSYGIALFSLIAAPFIIYGGMQMLNGKKYGLSKIAAILAIIPFTSCCFLVGIPLGIWAFLILRNPEVKAYFEGQQLPYNTTPPPPTF